MIHIESFSRLDPEKIPMDYENFVEYVVEIGGFSDFEVTDKTAHMFHRLCRDSRIMTGGQYPYTTVKFK